MQSDPRGIHVKLVNVEGKFHFCTVLPPGPEPKAPTFPQQVSNRKPSEAEYGYDGPDLMADYAMTKADQHS